MGSERHAQYDIQPLLKKSADFRLNVQLFVEVVFAEVLVEVLAEVFAEVLVEVLAETESGIGLGMHFACRMQHFPEICINNKR